jgi:hypothetical protein
MPGMNLSGNATATPLTEAEKIEADRAMFVARIEELEEENADLKQAVIAHAAPWAVSWAQMYGLPPGHLHPVHYDLLKLCGARMTDFTRAEGLAQ